MRRPLALLGLLAWAVGCAGAPPVREAGFPVLSDADTDPRAGYERPPTLVASTLLPPELAASSHHRVHEEVRTNGFLRIYRVDSDFGRFEALGDAALRFTVQEIRAVAALHALHRAPACEEARRVANAHRFVQEWDLVTHPCESVHGVPPDAWNEVMSIAHKRPEERTHEDNAVRNQVLNFESSKRRIAQRLGVSPYSLNRALQRPLNEISWAVSAGGLPLVAVPQLVADSVAPVPEDIIPAARLASLYQFSSPEDLRRRNRIELAVMGLDDATATAFLSHPAYSPRQQTGIVESLVALDPAENRVAFVESALLAETSADALLYLMNALLLRAYHQDVDAIQRVVRIGRSAGGLAEDGTFVVPFQVDTLVWSRPTERFVDRLRDLPGHGVDAARAELYISGEATPLARKELAKRGVDLVENHFGQAVERLAPR